MYCCLRLIYTRCDWLWWMEDRETPRMHEYGASKTTRIMMATVRYVTSSSGLRKFQADGFLFVGAYLSISWARKQIVVVVGAYKFWQLRTNFYLPSCCQSWRHMQRKFFEIINVDFDATDQLLIIYSAFVTYLRKNWNTTKQWITSLWTSRKLMIRLRGRSYNIFIEFGIPLKLIKKIKSSDWNL